MKVMIFSEGEGDITIPIVSVKKISALILDITEFRGKSSHGILSSCRPRVQYI